MPLSFVTWNSQGDPRNSPAKTAQLNNLLTAHGYVLVQEAGALAAQASYTVLGVQYTILSEQQAGAFNNRCGTAILTRRNFVAFAPYTLPNSNGRFGLSLRDTGMGVIVGTLHSNAAANAGVDRTGFLQHLDRNANGGPVMVGGDFNAVPPPNPFNIGTFARPDIWEVYASGGPTQFPGGLELDYFIGRGVVVAGAVARDTPGVAAGSAGSDHKWVTVTIS
ncbi:MAG: endonuclease/exonuclease/phosphatase family protein [Azospirillaceae bacterium]|nr:endonuclease/exonuclease/phosphatase family protein [Azospirillaceae bacterium]